LSGFATLPPTNGQFSMIELPSDMPLRMEEVADAPTFDPVTHPGTDALP